MKATILAIAISFAASGVMATEADAQSRRRSYNKTRTTRTKARTPRRARNKARTYRSTTRRTVRQPTRRHVRQPTRRHVRRPARRHVRRPARRHVRRPARRTYRQPARRHYRRPYRRHYRPARRYYRPVYRSAVNTVTLSNSQHFGLQVVVRAGHSSVCSANPVQSNQYLAPGSSVTVTTYGSYVCYRQLSTRFTAGTGWYRAVLSGRYTNLSF